MQRSRLTPMLVGRGSTRKRGHENFPPGKYPCKEFSIRIDEEGRLRASLLKGGLLPATQMAILRYFFQCWQVVERREVFHSEPTPGDNFLSPGGRKTDESGSMRAWGGGFWEANPRHLSRSGYGRWDQP